MTGRWRLEGELNGESTGDDFTKVQSLNYLRQLVRELEGIADTSRPVPWDAHSDYGPEIVRKAAKSASDYLRGWGAPRFETSLPAWCRTGARRPSATGRSATGRGCWRARTNEA